MRDSSEVDIVKENWELIILGAIPAKSITMAGGPEARAKC
jgi:hypothetical protein